MIHQPTHDRFDVMCHAARRQAWAIYQNHRYPQGSCRFQLGLSSCTARILGDNQGNAVVFKQGQILGFIERAARDDRFCLRQGQGFDRRVNKAQQIVVLRFGGERQQVLFADGQKHPLRRLRQGRDRFVNVGNQLPVVIWARPPRRAFQRTKADASRSAGRNRIAAHLGGEGVSRVNNMGDVFAAQIGREPLRPAKPANPGGQRLGNRMARAPGIGKHRLNPGRRQRTGKVGCFGGAAQQQDTAHV